MAANIPSLGDDDRQELKLVVDSRPLPKTREERIAAFGTILSLGGVQKVVFEAGQPIKFSRFVKKEATSEEPKDASQDELFDAVMDNPVEEYVFPKTLPLHEYLFKAFNNVSRRKMRPLYFFVNNLDLLRQALGVDSLWDLDELFGVPVRLSEQVPDDVLLLSAGRSEDGAIKLSLRMLIPEVES